MRNIIYFFVIFSFLITGNSIADDFSRIAIHGFISQGYLKSSGNNFIADSEDGTFQFNEMGINFGTNPVPGLYIGVQFFANDLGKTGNDEVIIDWAVADYKWRPYLGIKVGKLKLPYGLYNKTRDIDMLRVPIFLPQSVYIDNFRETMNALKGGTIYGKFPVSFIGKISYEILYGTMTISENGGLAYYSESVAEEYSPVPIDIDTTDIHVDRYLSYAVTWDTNINGLTFKYSGANISLDIDGKTDSGDETNSDISRMLIHIYSVQYSFQNFLFSSECMTVDQKKKDTMNIGGESILIQDEPSRFLGNYAGISYSFGETVEIGYYYSLFFTNRNDKTGKDSDITPLTNAYEKDHCLSIRYNINDYWTLKLEDHIIKGTALRNPGENDTDKYKKNWNLLALKLSYRF